MEETPTLPVDLTLLSRWLVEHQGSIVDDLRTFVEIESPSDHPESLGNASRWLEDWIIERAGPPLSRRREISAGYGDTLVITWPGSTGRHTVASGAMSTSMTDATSTAGLVVLAHYDTVWPLGTLAELPFRVEGDVLRGPGIFDMKAGIVQFAWAIAALDAFGAARPPLTIVLNGDEEIGSVSSRPIIEEVCRDVGAVLVFEPSEHGALKTARKGVGFFDIAVRGVEAHAGLDPSAGSERDYRACLLGARSRRIKRRRPRHKCQRRHR